MTEAEARSVFSFFVTQFDERSQGMRMDYEARQRGTHGRRGRRRTLAVRGDRERA